MNVVGLKDAPKVGLVGLTLSEAPDCRIPVAESLEEREGEILRVKGDRDKFGHGIGDRYCVHLAAAIPAKQNKLPSKQSIIRWR